MSKDKKILYLISFSIFAILLALLAAPMKNSRIFSACVLIVMAVISRLLIRKKKSLSINKKEVLLLSAVVGTLYVILLQLSGLFFNYYKNPYFINSRLLLTTVLPIIAIIVSSEILRSTLLSQNNKLVSLLAFLACLLADVLSFSNIAGIVDFDRFMDLIGLTLFPAISANVYYHYASRRYGAIPNIVFRVITTLYVYFMPTVPDMSDALLSVIKLIIPIVMYGLISALFEKKKKNALHKNKKMSVVASILTAIVVISVAMLISCQFRFGAIVVATESMTGEINKGDMIIYEEYRDQKIEEGQVIVFLENDNRIIHRVVKIVNIGNETRYYTKGDANNALDVGYRTDGDIVGLTDIKVAYIGYPTLWLRQIIKN